MDLSSSTIYLQSPHILRDVVFVDTPETLARAARFLRFQPVVGLGCKRRPSLNDFSPESATILQVSTRCQIFIVDMDVLGGTANANVWENFTEAVFENKEVLKLFCAQDVNIIQKTIPGCANLGIRGPSRLPLDLFWKFCTGLNILKPRHETSLEGLSGLAQAILGKPLNPRDQFSDWSRRPLSQSQLYLAAVEVRTLVRIYDFIFNLAVAKRVLVELDRGVLAFVETPPNPRRVPRDLEIVCDYMLPDLHRELRRRGVNAGLLGPNDASWTGISLPVNGEQIIVTNGFLRAFMFLWHCRCPIQVFRPTTTEQVDEVFRFFNVIYREDDVAPNCLKCGRVNLIIIPGSVIVAMKERAERDGGPSLPTSSSSDPWLECEGGDVNLNTFSTRSGTALRIDTLPYSVAEQYEVFFACDGCGQIHWKEWRWDEETSRNEAAFVSRTVTHVYERFRGGYRFFRPFRYYV